MLKRGIILIYEHCHRLTGLLICRHDDSIETIGKLGCWIHIYSILLLIILESYIKVRTDSLSRSPTPAHIKTNHGMMLPFLLQLHDFQSLKEFFIAFEIVLEGIYKHRFAESTRTTQVVVLVTIVHQIPHQVALVNIHEVTLPDFLKRLNAYRQSSSIQV